MIRFTRREALHMIGMSAAATAALPDIATAEAETFPKGAVIRTLFKDYAPEELAGGATLFHEHLQLAADFNQRFAAATAAVRAANGVPPAPARGARPGGPAPSGPPPTPPPDPMRNPDLMAEELRNTRRAGAVCIVDAGHADMGRDLAFVREAAMKAGVPVVAGVGFYAQPFYEKNVLSMSEQQVYDALLKQVDDAPGGVFGEIGSWDEITKDERKVFRAVGRAAAATNLSIITHTGIPGKSALEQLDILEDAGVNPDRVVIGHLGNLVDANVYVHKQICRRGGYVGFDRQGGNGNGDAQVVPLIQALVDAGYAKHILVSGDASRGYERVLTNFVPRLKSAGVGDDVLHTILVDNPRRFLAFVPKRPRPRA